MERGTVDILIHLYRGDSAYEGKFLTDMRPSDAMAILRAAIRKIVEAHRAENALAVGSVLHGHDQEGSDLNILIDPAPATTLFENGAIRRKSTALLGIPVDVLKPSALPEKFRAEVLLQANPI